MSGELPSGRPPGGGKKEIDLGGVASGISPRNKSPRSVSPRKSSPRKKKAGSFIPKKPSRQASQKDMEGKILCSHRSQKTVMVPSSSSIEAKGHNWVAHSFKKPTWCDFCEKFIWPDSSAQRCRICNYNAHGECVLEVRELCLKEDRQIRKRQLRQNQSYVLNGSLNLTNLLSDSTFSDIVFEYSSGQVLYGHSFILDYRCPVLGKMADDLRKKASRGSFFGKGKKEHTVARFTWNVDDPSFCSPQTMSLILKFLYADDNTFHGILSEQKSCLAEAWKFSSDWDLGRLKQMIVAKHAEFLNSETVYELLKSADTFSAKPLKRQCAAVAHGNLQEFISQKEKASNLGVDLFQEMLESFYDGKAEKSEDQSVLNGAIPPSTYCEDLARIHERVMKGEEFADGYVEVEKSKIPVNKSLLAAKSKVLAGVLKPSTIPENVTSALLTEDMKTASCFRALLSFIYYGNTDVEALDACALVSFATKFEVDGLMGVCEKQMKDGLTHEVVFDVLHVVFSKAVESEGMRILEKSALDFAAANFEYLDLTFLKKIESDISSDIMYRLLTTIQIAPPQLRVTRKEKTHKSDICCFGCVDNEIWGGSHNGVLSTFSLDGEHVADLSQQHNCRIRAILFIPEVDHVWSISQDGRIIIWDVSEVEEGVRGRVTLKKLDGGHNGELRGALVVPGEEYPFVWTAALDGVINAWDTKTQSIAQKFQVNQPILSLCLSETGICFGSKGQVGCVSFAGAVETYHETALKFEKISHMLCAETGELWTFSESGTIQVWKNGKVCRTLTRHKSKIVSAVRTGGLVWSCAADSVMICWKSKTYEAVRILRGNTAMAPIAAVCAEESPPCVWTSTKKSRIFVWKKD